MSQIALVFEKFDGFNPVLSILTTSVEKLGIEYLGAVLEGAGHTVALFDNELDRISSENLAWQLNSGQYDIIGLSINSGNLKSSFALLEKIAPGPFVVVGGVTPSLHINSILEEAPRIDGVVIGEGEQPLARLAEWIDKNGSSSPVISGLATHQNFSPLLPEGHDLDELPQLRHLQLGRYEQAAVNTARGCRYACSFCAESLFLHRAGIGWHARSAEHVLEELEYLNRERGVKSLWIVDGDFIGRSTERVKAICHGILSEKLDLHFEIDARADDVEPELFSLLRDAGLRRVFIGVESTSPRLLRMMHKQTKPDDVCQALDILKQLGISYTLGMIPFAEEILFEELAQDVFFMKEQGFENIGSHLFMGMKDYSLLYPRLPLNFKDERVAAIFRQGQEFEKRLNLCYAGRAHKFLTLSERQQLVYEINHFIGNELLSLVQKYA